MDATTRQAGQHSSAPSPGASRQGSPCADSLGPKVRPAWQGYCLAVVVTAVTVAFRLAIDTSLDGKATLILFVFPIIISAYWGGWGAGLLATGLSAVWGLHHLLANAHGLVGVPASSWWNWLFFALCGAFISYVNGALHRARRRAEVATRSTRQAEDRMQVAFRDTHDFRAALDEHAVVTTTDPRGSITFANEKFCALSQYSREELVGHDHRVVNSGHHSKDFIRGLWQAISHGHVWQGEMKNRAKDGSSYWVSLTIVPFLGADGTPWQYLSIGTDITERKTAEAAAAHLAALVEYSADAILSIDLEGIVVTWNHGAQKIFGYLPSEMIGRSTYTFIPPERHGEEREILERIRRGESVLDLETVRVRKDGSLIDLSVTVSAIRDAAGRVVGASKVARDITARKRAEEEVIRLNTELEARVAERTAELQFANRELEAFSYSVSHDLRAPLRAVDGYSQAVVEDYGPLLPEEGLRYLRTIRQGAQQMGTLIDDLLTFSRLSRAPLKKQDFSMGSLVHAVWEDLASARIGRSLEFRVETLPACQADPALLREVWMNLLSNAIKYTRKRDQAVVEVGAQAAGRAPVFFVRDNGSGFDMRFKEKLFGVFQRLHRPEDYEGTGVGLALVQRIIHRHGGHVWAEGVPDRGAAFYFTLQPTDPL